MGATRHSRTQLDGFLDREFRQVWAVDRATRAPRYLPEGQAEALRATAKKHWGCPVPGCDTPISTRGGSRRDHFFHVHEPRHPSDGESDFHLAAKAMIADLATGRAPAGLRVVEERTTRKDPATSRYRRADVMVEADGRPVIAFEVEYKTFSPQAWSVKHRDYTGHRPAPIHPVWLLGHSRIHRTKRGNREPPSFGTVKVDELTADEGPAAGEHVVDDRGCRATTHPAPRACRVARSSLHRLAFNGDLMQKFGCTQFLAGPTLLGKVSGQEQLGVWIDLLTSQVGRG